MKRISNFISIILITFSLWFNVSNAWWFGANISIGWWWTNSVPYCDWWDCWLEKWVEAVQWVDAVVTDISASVYIQNVVEYILWFLMLMCVLIIIYAWFVLMFWIGDEEKAKKTKLIITYAIIWLVIIYLAWPLTEFILNLFYVK